MFCRELRVGNVELTSKQVLRSRLTAARVERSVTELVQVGELISELDWKSILSGTTIGCYASLPTEPPTALLRKKLLRLGYSVYLPIITESDGLLWGKDCEPLITNRFGISEPKNGELNTGDLSCLIMPAIAVDGFGNRLGKGAGYFDKGLTNVASFADGGPLRIALVFDEEVLSELPHESHDQKIDLIVTPQRVISPINT